MATDDSQSTYLEKEFIQPEFIWKDGICDVQAVQSSVEHLLDRLADIIPKPTEESPEITVPDKLQSGSEVLVPSLQSNSYRISNAVTSDSPQTDGRSPVTPSNTAIVPLRSDVWNGIEPINYHAQIMVGQDQKPFFVDLDTGSSFLWLQSQLKLDDSPISDQNTYIPSKSNTALDLRKRCTISYGDGSTVEASLFTDMVSLGTLTVEDQLLAAAASHDIKDEFRSKSSNGLLGLGFPLQNAATFTFDSEKPQNLVLALHARGQIKYASLTIVGPRNDPKLAALIDKKAIMQPRGYFVIGSVDSKFYTGSISWCPQLIPNRWVVTLDAVMINGVTICRDQKALIDTGTPYMVASPVNYEKVISSIMGARKYNQYQGHYFVYPEGNVSSVSFTFGGRTFDLFPQDFTLGGISLFSKKPVGGAANVPAKPSIPLKLASIIRLAKWQFDDDLWIMGGIFLDNIVTTFDFGNRQIGFATINPNHPED